MVILKNKWQITNLDIVGSAKMSAKGGHIELLRKCCFVHNDAILELKTQCTNSMVICSGLLSNFTFPL